MFTKTEAKAHDTIVAVRSFRTQEGRDQAYADAADHARTHQEETRMTSTVDRFTRQPDSTHVVIYGNGSGELLGAYFPSLEAAEADRDAILAMAASEGFDSGARVDDLAALDALEAVDAEVVEDQDHAAEDRSAEVIAQRVRISKALGGFRYGGLLRRFPPSGRGYVVPGGSDEPTEAEWLDHLAAWLEEFSDVIARYADEDPVVRYEGLQRDVAAFRRVLGTAPADD